MRDDDIQKIYSMLNTKFNNEIHEYKLKIRHRGIDIYPNNLNMIYVLNSLIRKVLIVNPHASFFINFKEGYLRIH